MAYRFSAVTIRDFARLYEVTITPSADSSLILLDGFNRQGKTSILNALSTLLAGKRVQPTDPVRHGAEFAELIGELQDPKLGALRIHRVIKPDGTTTLKLTGPDGAVASPQKVLDAIIGARFVDPISFLNLKSGEQREMLFKVIDSDGKLAKLDENYAARFKKRTEIGRDHKHAVGEYERLPPETEPPTILDTAKITAEKTTFAEQHRALDKLESEVLRAQGERREQEKIVADIKAEIAKAQAEIRRLTELVKQRTEDLEPELDAIAVQTKRHDDAVATRNNARAAWDATAARRAEIDRDILAVDATNKKAAEIEFANKRRREASDTVERMAKAYAEETAFLDKLERRKTQILSDAKLPLENLSYNDEGLTLNGVPFSQASGAERFRVAIGIAAAASPNLADVWIRDGAILDPEQLELVAKYAEEKGLNVWIERVGKHDDGAIIIEDGRIVE